MYKAINMLHKSQIAFTTTHITVSSRMSILCISIILLYCITLHPLIGKASAAPQSGDNTRAENSNGNASVTATSELCLERSLELDRCLPKLVFYGDRAFKPPQSDEQLDKHCAVLNDNLKCVSSYSRECLPTFARNLYSVVIRRMKTQFAKRCKTTDGRRDFLEMMACADNVHMEPAHKCMDSFIAHLEHIGQGSQSRQIELTCCTFQLFQNCIFTASKQLKCAARKVTAEQSINYVRTIIKTMGGDMMEFMCGRYETIAACESGYPKQMATFRGITDRVLNGTTKARARSPLRPMLQLFIDSQQGND